MNDATDRNDHERLRHLLGAYILGGLDEADRAAVDAHVAQCAGCQEELTAYEVVPDVLSRVRPRRTRRRAATIAAVAGIAACTLAAGVGLGTMLRPQDQAPIQPTPAQRTVRLAAGEGGATGGTADLAAKPWGTELRLDLHDLPPGRRLEVVAVGEDGRAEPAGTWTTPGKGTIRLTGATSMRPDAVRRIDIRADQGRVIATTAK